MKELSIEEKAKRYDEILVRAEGANLPYYKEDIMSKVKEFVDYLIPELKLKESENADEKVRKALIKLVTNHASMDLFIEYDIHLDEALAWFEKQGEQKPAIIIQKFRVGDEIKTNNEESLTITKIDEKGYWSDNLFICSFEDSAKWELVEQKPAWSEEDERLLSKLQTYVDLECFDRECNGQDLIDWFKSLKDRVQPQPKQEWSEEDKAMLDSAIAFVEHSAFTTIGKGKNNVISWLKSLKERIGE